MSFNYYNNNTGKKNAPRYIESLHDFNDSWKQSKDLPVLASASQKFGNHLNSSYIARQPQMHWWDDNQYMFKQERSEQIVSDFSIHPDISIGTINKNAHFEKSAMPPGLSLSPFKNSNQVSYMDNTSLSRHTKIHPTSFYNKTPSHGSKLDSSNQQHPNQFNNYVFNQTYNEAEEGNKENNSFGDANKSSAYLPSWRKGVTSEIDQRTQKKPQSFPQAIIHQLFHENSNSTNSSRSTDKNVGALHSSTSTHKNNNKNNSYTKYVSDTVYLNSISNIDEYNLITNRQYTVVKITNIPWSINVDKIKNIFQCCKYIELPSEFEIPQAIHVLMDIKTGKTLGVAFAEVKLLKKMDREELENLLSNFKLSCTQGRRVRFRLSSYDELRNDLFPSWKGEFKDGHAIPYTTDTSLLSKTISNANTSKKNSAYFIDQKDLQSLLNICRHFKAHYNRRCPDRPFEYFISIIMNIPWKQPKTTTTLQRDIIYECYKLITDVLRIHTAKALHSFDNTLLERLVRAALLCEGFTVKQKTVILNNAHLQCPEELKIYLQEPPSMNNREFTSFLDE